ncbi:MAG: radical SAM protein, partial [Anaerolineae bacterium]
NPAPMAPYLDAVLVGELEAAAADLAPALLAVAAGDAPVADLAQVPGLYVPQVHHDKGAVRRVWAKDLDEWPTATVVATPFTEFGGMHLVEMARGCMRSCRFCLAGHIYRPVRERSAELVLRMAREGAALGRTVGLVAPSLSDARGFRQVLRSLVSDGSRVSVSSLRADSLDDDVMADLAAAGNEAITIAPEAGCARLRALIGKDLDEAAVLATAERAERHGFRELKLYFIVGLPTETEDDVRSMAALVRQVRGVFTRRLVANVSCFVPKPSTPFQWQGFMPVAELEKRLGLFAAALRGTGVTVRSESPEWSLLQAVLARGDERVGLALREVDGYSRARIERALVHGGVDLEAEAGPRVMGAPLPWDVIESGLPPGYLERRGTIGGE